MPIARAKSTKRGAVKIAADRVARGGAFMLDADAVTRTTIPIASKAIGTLSRNSQRVGQLIESFGAALERMQKTGRAFRLMVDVEPKEALKIREIDSASGTAIIDAAPEVANADLDRALAAARERGRRRVAEILSDPDMLSAENLARLLGTTRATINTKRQNHQLLGLEGATRGFRFPGWPIGEDGKPFAALPTLFDRLGDSPLGRLPFPRPEPSGARWRDGPRRASQGPDGRRHRSGGKRRRDIRLSDESVQPYAFFQSRRAASGDGRPWRTIWSNCLRPPLGSSGVWQGAKPLQRSPPTHPLSSIWRHLSRRNAQGLLPGSSAARQPQRRCRRLSHG